jgi:hypothetical protein
MRLLFTFILIFVFQVNIFSSDFSSLFKDRGVIEIKIHLKDLRNIEKLSKVVSIDKLEGFDVIAYANQKEFKKFLKFQLPYEIIPYVAPTGIKMSDNPEDVLDWDSYPTYEAYVQMMHDFADNNPSICKLYSIGQTVEGRELLFVKISDNVNKREPEPQFLYTSTMHGDETTGYILMLHLIDYLLSNYRSDSRVRNLVNNLEIWINPLANPDGTYHGGNNSVQGAMRYNANYVDPNRNFPDPDDGPHPDGEVYQPETVAMMNLADSNNFIMSANFHGGAEVVNYPWDTWYARHPDDAWFQTVSHEYADTAHEHSPIGYMSGFDDGITNGYDWYTISGGRQDFMNYYHHCREVTIELSDTKLLPESQLLEHWEYNYRSFLNYINRSLYGIQGMVTDSLTGKPVAAKIEIVNHDAVGSEVYSDTTGRFSRPINDGTYTVKVSADSFFTKTFTNVAAFADRATWLDVKLVSTVVGVDDENTVTQKFILEQNYPNPFNPTTVIRFTIPNRFSNVHCKLSVYDMLGNKVKTLVDENRTPGNYEVSFTSSGLSSGIYFYRLRAGGFVSIKKMILLK